MSENKMDALVQKVADALVYAKDTTRLETAVLLNVAELDAISAALQPQPEPVAPDKWVIAKETVSDTGDPRPELGYTVIPDFPLFDTDVAAIDAIKQVGLPIGWVILKLSQLLPNLSLSPAPKPQGEPVACDCECTTQEERDRCPWTPVCDQAKAAAPPTPAADVAPERVSDAAQSIASMVIEWVEMASRNGPAADWKSSLPSLIERRLARFATPAASAGAVDCKHEPFEGKCVHCNVPFVNGIAAPAEPAAGDVVSRAVYLSATEKLEEAQHDLATIRAQLAELSSYYESCENQLADRESRIAALTEANERLEAHADRMAHSHIPKNAKVYELESRIAALEGERERLHRAMRLSLECLQATNEVSDGPICDTIWFSNTETLFDYMEAALSVASHDAAPTTAAGG